MLGFLQDRTRVLVTHNMSLSVASADLVICLDSCDISPADACNPNQPRSQVVACCAPSQLQSVIQTLKARSTTNSDVSVFLEGLIAAAALASKDVPGGDRSTPAPHAPPQQTSPASEETSIESAASTHGALEGVQPSPREHSGGTAPLTASALEALDAANGQSQAKEKSRLRPNFSYESLRQGFNSILTPSPSKPVAADNSASSSKVLSAQSSVDSSRPDCTGGAATPAAGKDGCTIVDKEGKSVGRVGWEVYWFYFKACGGVRAVVGIVGGTALCSLAW